MTRESPVRPDLAKPLSRRELLGRSGMGFGLLGLTGILAGDNLLTSAASVGSPEQHGPLSVKASHFAGKARQVDAFVDDILSDHDPVLPHRLQLLHLRRSGFVERYRKTFTEFPIGAGAALQRAEHSRRCDNNSKLAVHRVPSMDGE